MNDLFAILDAIGQQRGPAVLATLVRVDGSSFRRPGARMLMTAEGERVGSITGPCLEAEIGRQAARLTTDSPPVLVTYDTGREDDAIMGYGLACPGKLHILLERIEAGREPQYLAYLRQSLAGGQTVVVATVYSMEGAGPVEVGARLMLRGEDVAMSGVWPGDLAAAAMNCAQRALLGGQSFARALDYGGCKLATFFEVIGSPTRLFIFGATDVAKPLVRLAKELCWHVTVHDRRAGYADAGRFPMADEILSCAIAEVPEKLLITERSAAVIMTHNYPDDLALLAMLLAMPVPYIGLLSSRQRAERLIDDLGQQQADVTAEQLRRLHAPVGLDIGSESPTEIALAIVAEVQAALSHRSGQPLRGLKATIHERAAGSGGEP